MEMIPTTLQLLSSTLTFLLGLIVLWLAALYIKDKYQTQSTLRRNFPILARFRYTFEHLGKFFRQYFFAFDRQELPFNRAERSWVYQSAKNISSTAAFGSTRNIRTPGTVNFVNAPFPPLQPETTEATSITFGPYCEKPYETSSLFNISGMSYGSISKPAVKALSKGAALANIWLNTGEGGLSPYHLEGNPDIIFQIGTAKYGVRNQQGEFDEEKLALIAAQPEIKMFELKLSQGAKPGKGGILPGNKVTKDIANIRGIPQGQTSISPNRHPEIDSVESLLDMITYIRNITNKPIGFKTVIGSIGWMNQLCKAINKRGTHFAPDFITIDSADGGSGAAPLSLIDNMGLPIRESLPLVIDTLEAHKLRERIKIIASGKLVTPAEVAWAYCTGADIVTSARGFMFALGCIQAMECNKNTCPTGIATHNKELQRGLDPSNKANRVANYAQNMHKELNVIAHSCGVQEPRQLKRHHARIQLDNGISVSMEELYSTLVVKS